MKKWIAIPAVLTVAALGAYAAMPKQKISVNSAMRSEAIDALVAKLNEHYVFPEKAKQMESVLRQRQREGRYNAITDGEQLSKQLTDDLQSVVHDQHLGVEFDHDVLPPDDVMGPPPSTLADWEKHAPLLPRLFRHVSKLGVDKVDHLSPRIGYLRVTEFPRIS